MSSNASPIIPDSRCLDGRWKMPSFQFFTNVFRSSFLIYKSSWINIWFHEYYTEFSPFFPNISLEQSNITSFSYSSLEINVMSAKLQKLLWIVGMKGKEMRPGKELSAEIMQFIWNWARTVGKVVQKTRVRWQTYDDRMPKFARTIVANIIFLFGKVLRKWPELSRRNINIY